MKRFEITELPLKGLKLVKRTVLADHRGFFTRLFCAEGLKSIWGTSIAQINHTLTKQTGSVRGMHFQIPPSAETKLVTCIRGRIWDVAVDVRAESPTFLQWHSAELSPDNQCSFLIPPGFAHGFQTLTDDCELVYLHSEFYSPINERGLHPQDPVLGIRWPLPVENLSSRDAAHPSASELFST